jgi:hypothetical protein
MNGPGNKMPEYPKTLSMQQLISILAIRLAMPIWCRVNFMIGVNMFPKPPKFVFNNKPVAVQVIKQQKAAVGAVDKHVLVVKTGARAGAADAENRQGSLKKQDL